MIYQPEITAPHHTLFSPSCLLLCSFEKKNEREERQQSSSVINAQRFICEGQRLTTGLIAPGVLGSLSDSGANWEKLIADKLLVTREYFVGGYGNNYVLEPILLSGVFHQQRLQEQSERQNNIPVIKAAISSPLGVKLYLLFRTMYNEVSTYPRHYLLSLCQIVLCCTFI